MILYKYRRILSRYFTETYLRKGWTVKKWNNVVKVEYKCIWFNFRYASIELFLMNHLKLYLLWMKVTRERWFS